MKSDKSKKTLISSKEVIDFIENIVENQINELSNKIAKELTSIIRAIIIRHEKDLENLEQKFCEIFQMELTQINRIIDILEQLTNPLVKRKQKLIN